MSKIDELVNSLEIPLLVIPAKAGIQLFQVIIKTLDSGFHRSDDFLPKIGVLKFDIHLTFACLPVGRDFDIRNSFIIVISSQSF
jgi:hypothetical protein